MTVTIHCDAQWSRTRQMGAYAFEIVSEQGHIKKCGPVPAIKSAKDAYLQSLWESLSGLESSGWSGVSKIEIYAGEGTPFGGFTWKAVEGGREANCFSVLQRLKARYRGVGFIFKHYSAVDPAAGEWCQVTARQTLQEHMRGG